MLESEAASERMSLGLEFLLTVSMLCEPHGIEAKAGDMPDIAVGLAIMGGSGHAWGEASLCDPGHIQ